MVGSEKLRTEANGGAKKTHEGFSKNIVTNANRARCAAILTTGGATVAT